MGRVPAGEIEAAVINQLRGWRKEMILPDDASKARKADNTRIKALARAFRWKRMLESGEFTTISELAVKEKIAPSYMTRLLRLTLLAPGIVEEILAGFCGRQITLTKLMEPFPVVWADQRL